MTDADRKLLEWGKGIGIATYPALAQRVVPKLIARIEALRQRFINSDGHSCTCGECLDCLMLEADDRAAEEMLK